MPAQKAGTKKSAAKKGSHREFSADRNKKIADMVTEVQGSQEKSDAFFANPATVAKQHGVTLSQEEVQAIKFMSGMSIARAIARMRPSQGFFDNNCSCGGTGTAGW